MTPNAAVRITHPLSTSANAHPLDVLKIKSALEQLGHYEAPDWGVSQFPDAALFAAVEKFQRDHRLKVDGVLKPGGPTEQALQDSLTTDQAGTALHTAAQALQDLGRNGDEILAHISPEEAQLLHDITDGGSINPETGLLEFWWGSNASSFDASADHKANQASANRSYSFDASSDHKSNQAAAIKSEDLKRDSTDNQSSLGYDANKSNTPNAKANNTKVAAETAKQARRNRVVTTPDNDPSFTSGFFDKKKDDDLDNQQEPASRYLDGLHGFDYISALIHGKNPMKKEPYPKIQYNGSRH